MALGILGGALSLGGLVSNVIGGSKATKGAKKAYEGLREANDLLESDLLSLREKLNSSELDIDDTSVKNLLSFAKGDLSSAEAGRIEGEEQARDSVRQSTADSIGRARRVGGSVADLLGFTSSASNDETNAMNNLDIQFSQDRQNRVERSKSRLQRALDKKIAFDRYKEQALFDRVSKEIDVGRYIAESKNRMAKEEIAQMGSIWDAKANIWSGAGNALSSAGDFAMNWEALEAYKDSLG